MSAVYDNWERLVAAVLKREQLWELFHDQSRSPSVLSQASSELSSLGNSSRLQNPKVVKISEFSPALDVDNFRLVSAELLGSGTFGSTYVAKMDNEMTIVVKRLRSVCISESEFKCHMDIIGHVIHENVVAPKAYYCSENERLMLYDYYSKGSVFALLHGQSGENQVHVDWETRLKIAIGAAMGIAEVHTRNGGKLVHGNIKSSNIFLNPQQCGCVSDLGLANIIETTFMPTAWCYAPEVKSTQHVSQASDVYSFGILLLELLTRKSTKHLPGGPEPVDLVKLVCSVKSKERAAMVFDADLLKDPVLEEDMVKMLQIGIKCASKSRKKRPKMSEVVKMLDGISTMYPARMLVSVEDACLYVLRVLYPTFDINYLYRTFPEVLGVGTFGTSYKLVLGNGEIIVVKILKDVLVTLEEFKQHMEVIHRMEHINIAPLRAYHFSRDTKLLVCDYYCKLGSLSDALHWSSGKTPLGWRNRLKIAVGAARGIARIHGQDGEKFVHGNVNSSNILIKGNEFGAVSHFGLAKVMVPIRLSAMPNPRYCASEVTDTSKVSQASDVYSFGVVLLQLLSGKQSLHTTYDGKVMSLVDWVQSIPRDEWITKVFDVELLRCPNEEKAMVELLQMAIDCVATVPEHRPTMPEVVKMLEGISGLDPSTELSLEDVQEEDQWERPAVESRLEDILEDLLPKMTP